MTNLILLPTKPEDVFSIYKKLPQELNTLGNSAVYLDQYTSEVVRVDNALKASVGDRILNSFYLLHYGTFGGLPTRILYVFVGLAPTILFFTGIVMYSYRRKKLEVMDGKYICRNVRYM